MKILKKGKRIKYPKQKTMHCDACGTKLRANFEDCCKEYSVLDILNYYVACPICGKLLYYCRYLGEGDKAI